MSSPLVMPSAGQKGLSRFVNRTWRLPKESTASPFCGMRTAPGTILSALFALLRPAATFFAAASEARAG